MARAPYPLSPVPVQKSWLERHAGWKIPLGILLAVGLLVAFIGLIFTIVTVSFRQSDVFREAIARAERNSQVAQRIGTPLRPGWLSQGNLHVSGSSGTAQMEIPVAGPRGKATITLDARKVAGTWHFRILQIQFEGQSDSINLLDTEEGTGTVSSEQLFFPALRQAMPELPPLQ